MRNFIVYLVCAAIFLAAQMFQGLSFLDIGMYLSGCEWLADAPLAVYYLCNWLMTFRVTTFFMNVFSCDSFFALRVFHLVYVLVTQVAVFMYCRKYIPEKTIILGLALATLAHFGAYTEINYNDYTIALLTVAVMMYHEAVRRESSFFLIGSGMVIAVSFFFRIVNISFILLPLWYGAYVLCTKAKSLRQVALQCWWFGCGVALGAVVMLGVIYADGMMPAFSLLVSDLAVMGGDSSDPHSPVVVIVSFFNLHLGEVKSISVVLLIFLLLLWVNTRAKSRKKQAANIMLGLMLVFNMRYMDPPSNYTVGLCILAFLLVLTVSRVSDEIKRLYVLAFFIPLLMPLGSNAEPEFYGKDLCFLTLPLALYVINTEVVRHKAWRISALTCLMALCSGFLLTNLTRHMMEEANRLRCLYGVAPPKAHCILTNRENADLNNKLFHDLRPLIEDGSYMYCDFSPTVVPLLNCRPYAVFSTVFTSDTMNSRYIDVAHGATLKLPLMLLRKDNDEPRRRHVVDCLKRKSRYGKIWEDDDYVLLKPMAYPCR